MNHIRGIHNQKNYEAVLDAVLDNQTVITQKQ